MSEHPIVRVPVLIVGGGLAGLSAAALLAWRGIPCIVVERHRGTSRHPRARGVNLRSLELLRQVPGLEADLVAAARPGLERFSMRIAESVTGRVIRTMFEPQVFDTSKLSPTTMCTTGQDRVEPILLRHARAHGADVRLATEATLLGQDADGVDLLLRGRDDGMETRVRAGYVIAADGNRSPIREALGITTSGRGTISHNMSILFEADLPTARTEGFCLYYLQNPAFVGTFVPTDDVGRWQVSVERDPAKDVPDSFTPERCVAIVRAALGLPEAAVTVLGAMPWEMTSRIADRMQVGRVFLAGDAAHTMPPTGGLGGQTAMQDGADLAWKLALVLDGNADPALLETYEAERLPVARLTVSRQTGQYVERMRPDRAELSEDDVESDQLTVSMGYRYRSMAIQDDATDTGAAATTPLDPSFRPGTRLGHVPLVRDGATISSLDLVGSGYVLIAGAEGVAWTAAATVLAATGRPITSHRLGGDLHDSAGGFVQAAALAPAGALLVRPDGFIAWRFEAAHAHPVVALEHALARVLCLPTRPIAKAA